MSCKVVILLALLAAVCARDLGSHAPQCACARMYVPVCGSNGLTYNNICEFNCRSKHLLEKFGEIITVVLEGRCDGSY